MDGTGTNDIFESLGQNILKDFFNDNNRAAYQGLNDLILQLIEYTNRLSQLNEIEKWDVIEELNNILQVLAEAIEVRDNVLICDLLEYELNPLLRKVNLKVGKGSPDGLI